MNVQIGLGIVAFFAAPLAAAFGFGAFVMYLREEIHYRDYHK